ncbi:lipoyl protein ligase domain-containing protein [Microbacterium sp.]|uniref:lipoyl protein ligase domain-containing protein n=1 Tax=Microbacterium sp. TaxID=51671 RepID=UPI003C768AB3
MTDFASSSPVDVLVLRDEPAVGDFWPATAEAELARSVELLQAVATDAIPQSRVIRLCAPSPTVAMSRRESRMPGFDAARHASIAQGFAPVVRPTGGRAVAYDQSCVVFDVIVRDTDGAIDQERFFEDNGERLAAELRGLGVDARLGEVPGEYCPGAFSVNARGAVKLIGTSQRGIRGARLLSGMLALGPVDRFISVLTAVNAALELEWDPATFGTLAHELLVVDRRAVESALIAALSG